MFLCTGQIFYPYHFKMVSAVPEDSENHTLFSGIYPFTQEKDSGNGSQGGSSLDENELMFVLFVCLLFAF